MAHNDLHCLPYSFDFWLRPLFGKMVLTRFKDWIHFRNSGMKGFRGIYFKDFPPFIKRETTFVISCLLLCTPCPSEKGEQILSFWSRPGFSEEGKTILTELPPLKVYQFSLKSHLLLFTLYSTLDKTFNWRHIEIFFLFFPEKRFDISCKFSAWNVKSYFLGKIRKILQNSICW